MKFVRTVFPKSRLNSDLSRPILGGALFIDRLVAEQTYPIDELHELENMYKVQKHRLSVAVQSEMMVASMAQAEGKPWSLNASIRDNIFLLVEILSRIIQFKQDLGLVAKSPGKLEITGEVLQKELACVYHVIDELPLHHRMKLLELMEGRNGKCLQNPSQNT